MTKIDGTYPRVEMDLKKLRHNIDQVVSLCNKQGVGVAGVVKGFSGIPDGIKQFDESDCAHIGTSRMEQIEAAIKVGVQKPLMLIRIPMLSEVVDVVRLVDISLNSELTVLKALNEEAEKQGKLHQVLLMVDLGDLREGFWDQEELVEVAKIVEYQLKSLKLMGAGTNLGCYGSIAATPEKMEELIDCAEAIEKEIGRKLDIISGGATSSLPLIMKGSMPKRVNHLRIGEGIILAQDLAELYGYDMSFLNQDTFVLKAEIIELKVKPSFPVGELAFDAFGNVGTYEDRGMRKRALVGLGKVDFAYLDALIPLNQGVSLIGASSDHLILDMEDCNWEPKVGDVLEFSLCYATMVYATNSPNVKIICK